MNLLERESPHQRAKYLKYKKLNKAFAKKNNPKEETVILDDASDSDSSSSSEANNYPVEDEKTCITYDSESADDDKINKSYIDIEGNN